ncbi:hypothetical protein GQ53DRAFT_117622 [Thozetella sp. PMI_491]|nr:hypothetical protein GQ53DRAFT_117622 [Thozetella sp. PMI_491]
MGIGIETTHRGLCRYFVESSCNEAGEAIERSSERPMTRPEPTHASRQQGCGKEAPQCSRMALAGEGTRQTPSTPTPFCLPISWCAIPLRCGACCIIHLPQRHTTSHTPTRPHTPLPRGGQPAATAVHHWFAGFRKGGGVCCCRPNTVSFGHLFLPPETRRRVASGRPLRAGHDTKPRSFSRLTRSYWSQSTLDPCGRVADRLVTH